MKNLIALPLLALIFLNFACSKSKTTDCEISIVGAGAGGLHTAYRLVESYGEKLCIFEKENRVGGRFYDIALNEENEKKDLVIGNGARRIMEGQSILFELAEELGIDYETPETGSDIIYARDLFSSNKDDFISLYPELPIKENDAEDLLVEQLLTSPLRNQIEDYPSVKDYMVAVIGNDGYSYLKDMSRFQGDFEYPISAKSYIDWLEEEISYCCQTYYPVGGMSSFAKTMADKVSESGGRIFLNEAVLRVNKTNLGYRIETTNGAYFSSELILALPPLALKKLEGDVIEKIKSQEAFQSILPVKVTVINQWFETPWWLDIKVNENEELWRAYTTVDTSNLDGRCIKFVEFPPEKAAIEQSVVRVVYNDQKDCAEMWSELAQKNDFVSIEAKISEGLEFLLNNNGISSAIKIPKPIQTSYWQWEDAWHWLNKDTKLSNQDVFNWALNPIAGEKISLVGEAYNPQRSTWSDAAFKSSIHYLENRSE